jgi:alpha-ketoglutarate-dependent taurine dioxygenase
MTAWHARDIKPLIGSEVVADREALIDGRFAAELRALLIARGVLVFRDLEITPEEQRAITATLGTIAGADTGDALQKVKIDEEGSAEYSAYVANTMFWHMDGSHGQTTPCFGGSFRPIQLAGNGGETEFLNTYAAYEGLGESDKALVDGLHVLYSAPLIGLMAVPAASDEQIAEWRSRPRARQPLVWEHEAGRKSLMLGVAVGHVEGMEPADSYDLLARLRAHAYRQDYVYRHAWRPNDLLIWNNTGTMHRARPFDRRSGRLLHRYTLAGEEQIRAPRTKVMVRESLELTGLK